MSSVAAWSRLRHGIGEVRDSVLGIVYPRLCVGCEIPLLDCDGGILLCADCEDGLETIEPPFCSVCGQSFDGVMSQGFQCVNCGDRHLSFDFAVCAYRSHGLARELVHRFKYERRHHLASVLRELTVRAASDSRVDRNADWAVVPVPLHPRRMREREFNQAEVLARGLTDRHGWQMVPALRRVRYTRRQARLDRSERLDNLKQAFVPASSERHRAAVRGRPVLLVDDVLTTGATASTCAEVLKGLGSPKVVVVTAVRG